MFKVHDQLTNCNDTLLRISKIGLEQVGTWRERLNYFHWRSSQISQYKGQLHGCMCDVCVCVEETISRHAKVGVSTYQVLTLRSRSEGGISFPLGGELMRRASSPCKIDHESRSIQIKVNTAPSCPVNGVSILEVCEAQAAFGPLPTPPGDAVFLRDGVDGRRVGRADAIHSAWSRHPKPPSIKVTPLWKLI